MTDEQLIDDIYEFTGMVMSYKDARDIKKLIEHYIQEYKTTYFCRCDEVTE